MSTVVRKKLQQARGDVPPRSLFPHARTLPSVKSAAKASVAAAIVTTTGPLAPPPRLRVPAKVSSVGTPEPPCSPLPQMYTAQNVFSGQPWSERGEEGRTWHELAYKGSLFLSLSPSNGLPPPPPPFPQETHPQLGAVGVIWTRPVAVKRMGGRQRRSAERYLDSGGGGMGKLS